MLTVPYIDNDFHFEKWKMANQQFSAGIKTTIDSLTQILVKTSHAWNQQSLCIIWKLPTEVYKNL